MTESYLPDDVPHARAPHPLKGVLLLLLVLAAVHDGQQPGGALQGVGAARLWKLGIIEFILPPPLSVQYLLSTV